MMQVQGSNMMDMGGNSAAAFWGATRHSSWPAGNHSAGHNGAGGTAQSNPSDPKMAEKLMTELQVRFLEIFFTPEILSWLRKIIPQIDHLYSIRRNHVTTSVEIIKSKKLEKSHKSWSEYLQI